MPHSADKEALTQDEIIERLKEFPDWKQEVNAQLPGDGSALVRVQTFPSYKSAMDFVYQVGLAAEEANHHPDIFMNYKRVTVRYWTHTARGISSLDFKMADIVENLVRRFYHPSKS
jgi:4a-hydroxytetrahydrobiopterin dehydratase